MPSQFSAISTGSFVLPQSVGGRNDARSVLIRAYGKPFSPEPGAYLFANEHIGSSIGCRLGLPIPPHAMTEFEFNSKRRQLFCSVGFTDRHILIDATRCAKDLLHFSTGAVLFDMLIGNYDRHSENVSVDFFAKPPMPFLFDHSEALFGSIPNAGIARLRSIKNDPGIKAIDGFIRHVLINHIVDDRHFGEWFERIESFPVYMIEDICSEDGLGITAEERDHVIEFLVERRERLRSIVDSHRALFPGIHQWSLDLFF